MNFPDKNNLDLLCSASGEDGSILSWKMADFVVRNVGVVSDKNCWKCRNRSWLKKEENMETRRQTPASKKTQLLPKVSDAFCFCKCIHICIYFISLFLYLKYLEYEAFVFFFIRLFRYCAKAYLAWHRENCWLYSFTNTCWFFALAYLFRSRERIGKFIGFAKLKTDQAEMSWKRQISDRRHREREFRWKRKLCWRFERWSFRRTPEMRWKLQRRPKPVCLCWMWKIIRYVVESLPA